MAWKIMTFLGEHYKSWKNPKGKLIYEGQMVLLNAIFLYSALASPSNEMLQKWYRYVCYLFDNSLPKTLPLLFSMVINPVRLFAKDKEI